MKKTHTRAINDITAEFCETLNSLLTHLSHLISYFPEIDGEISDFALVESLLKLAISSPQCTINDMLRRLRAFSKDRHQFLLDENHDRKAIAEIAEHFPLHRPAEHAEWVQRLVDKCQIIDKSGNIDRLTAIKLQQVLASIFKYAENPNAEPTTPFDQPVKAFSRLDVMTVLSHFINLQLWREVFCPMQYSLLHFKKQLISSVQLTDVEIQRLHTAGPKICAEIMAEKIIPYLDQGYIDGKESKKLTETVTNQFFEDILYYLENTEQKFSAAHTLHTLLTASAELLIRKRFNQPLRPIEKIGNYNTVDLLVDSTLTSFLWKFNHKPYIQDHSEARIRHQLSHIESKRMHRNYSDAETQAAVRIQRAFRNRLYRPGPNLVTANVKTGDHSDLAHHMIALDTGLKKSLNRRMITRLINLMQTSHWHQDPMFQQYDNYQHYAVAAMLAGKISTDQCATVLRWRSAKKVAKQFETYSILASDDTAKVLSQQEKLDSYDQAVDSLKRLFTQTSQSHAEPNGIDQKYTTKLQLAVEAYLAEQSKNPQKIPKILHDHMMVMVNKIKDGRYQSDSDLYLSLFDYTEQNDSAIRSFEIALIWGAANGYLTLIEGAGALQWFAQQSERFEQVYSKIADHLNTPETLRLFKLFVQTLHQNGEHTSEWNNFFTYLQRDLTTQINECVPLSVEASQFLIPWLMENTEKRAQFSPPLTDEQIRDFTRLVAELPPSERVFYRFTTSDGVKDIFAYAGKEYIELSEGAISIYNMLIYGNNTAKCDLRFGQFTTDDIEAAEREGFRPGALATDTTFQSLHVHDEDVSQYEANRHDIEHAKLLSTLPNQTRNLFLAICDLLRQVSGYTWSKLIWEIIDFAYITNVYESNKSDERNKKTYSTQEILQKLLLRDLAPLFFTTAGPILLTEKIQIVKPKSIFWAFMIDLLKHPIKWQFYGVAGDRLTNELADYFDFAQQCLPFIQHDETKFAIIKLTLFYAHRNNADLAVLNQQINESQKSGTLGEISFIRRNLQNPPLFSIQINRTILDKVDDRNDLLLAVGILDSDNDYSFKHANY